MDKTFTYQGVNVQQAYQTLADSGVGADIARRIIGIWVGEAATRERTFGYSRVLTEADEACSPLPFARTFAHMDWIDGTSVVQAGETPTEKGFNERFHRIEADLDTLGQLVAQSYACMNAVRQTVSTALREISAELNRINADLAEIRRALPSTRTPIGPIGKGWHFVGKTKYFDRKVMVFRDDDGNIFNMPDAMTTTYPAGAEPRAPKLAEVFGRDKDIREVLDGPMTKRQLIEKFGDRISTDGVRLEELVASLPEAETFATLDEVVTRLADQDVSLLKGLGGEADMRSSLGIAATENTGTASVIRIEGVSSELGEALVEAGVKTAAELAELEPEKMIEMGRLRGLDVSLGAASRLVARGRVITGLGR